MLTADSSKQENKRYNAEELFSIDEEPDGDEEAPHRTENQDCIFNGKRRCVVSCDVIDGRVREKHESESDESSQD